MSKRIKMGKEKVSNFLFFQHMFIYPGFVSGQILFNTHPFLYPMSRFSKSTSQLQRDHSSNVRMSRQCHPLLCTTGLIQHKPSSLNACSLKGTDDVDGRPKSSDLRANFLKTVSHLLVLLQFKVSVSF